MAGVHRILPALPCAKYRFFPKGKVFCEELGDSFYEIPVFSANRKVQSKEDTPTWKLPLPRPTKISAQSNSNYNL